MTAAFHHQGDRSPDPEPGRHHRVAWRLHPALATVLHRSAGTATGQAFGDRVAEATAAQVLNVPIDSATALAAHRSVLERAGGDGLPLTAAGYLKPADVQAIATVLPTMRDWPFKITREVDVHPVLDFREHLKTAGLLRKYKASLRLTKAGQAGLADADELWRHLADALVPSGPGFNVDASVVVLVHMATTPGRIDIDAAAAALAAIGWARRGGAPVGSDEIYLVWNDLWAVLGTVGERASDRHADRTLSVAARQLVGDALLGEVEAPTRFGEHDPPT